METLWERRLPDLQSGYPHKLSNERSGIWDWVQKMQRDCYQTIHRTNRKKCVRKDERTFSWMGDSFGRFIFTETLDGIPQRWQLWCWCQNTDTMLWKTNYKDDHRSSTNWGTTWRKLVELQVRMDVHKTSPCGGGVMYQLVSMQMGDPTSRRPPPPVGDSGPP